jgi:hypothetical protein
MTQLFEAASVSATGRLDEAGLNKNQLALFGALLGIIMLSVWGMCYFYSLGAANPKFNNDYMSDVNSVIEGRFVDSDDVGGLELRTVILTNSEK